jgi:hypothetical protein
MLIVLVTPTHATLPVYLLPLKLITLIIQDLYTTNGVQEQVARDSCQTPQCVCVTYC